MPEGSHPALCQGPMGEESPQLSSPLSACEHVQGDADLGSDSCSRACAEPLDAGEGERPVSLVSTLSSGSSTADSRSLFGSTAALPSSSTPPPPSEEDIDLELVPAERSGGRRSPAPGGSRGRWLQQLDRKVNGAAGKKTSALIRHLTGSPVVADAMAPNPKLSYVDRVVMEIIETERMYVKDLRSIVEDYLAHIIDLSNLPIRPEQVCALFGNIEDIYEFNSELLQSLDMCGNDPVAIAQCFVNKSEDFEIYTQYCTNYPNSVAALTDCMRSKTLAKFFRERQAALKRSLPLGSYLLKPVQRILKYHLLLQEIAKHFDPDEGGYEVVQEAIDTMTGVAWYINDMKRKHEHAVRVQEIQSLLINWKGPDLTTYGELVLEGTFHVLRAKNTRTLFLFEKMLLITKKRGEHYVYKIHISCSTLMLLDSAKDPLLFSVIHFKHPKQPNTVQAKSVEEKRLWAHHIKRLILENHNTIVPQRAREAILDNSNYPGKYQYSPERLKKAESCQPEDFHHGGRNGRRRSEPAKRTTRSTKAVLKHADSEGALLGDRRSRQPAPGVGPRAPGEPRPEGPRAEELPPRRASLEQLSPARSEPKLSSSPGQGGPEREQEEVEEEEEEVEESYSQDILMGDDQVADFASSVLAAISCWHYRARALLSTHFTTDDQSKDAAEVKTPPGEEEEDMCRQEEKMEDQAVNEASSTQVDVQELLPLHCDPPPEEPSHVEGPSQRPESPTDTSEQDSETPEPHDTSRETGEEEGGSDSSGLHAEETSVLTNGELSEEEEEEEEEAPLDNKSLLPSSVLDQASAIAEHFISSLSRRSSLVSEDLGSLACPSPPVDDAASQSASAGMDLEKHRETLLGSSPEPCATGDADLSPTPQHEPAAETLAEGERRSTLSKQDRLLIRKIRKYYQHAEHQDADFSIKRRESLSYIPAGLVRNLSQQLNSVPQEKAGPVHRKAVSRNRPTSWSVFDLPGLERSRNAEAPQRAEAQPALEAGGRSHSVTDASFAEEEFRPSSDMLKVWQVMESEEESREAPQAEERVDAAASDAVRDIDSDASESRASLRPSDAADEPDVFSPSESSYVSTPSPASPASPALDPGPGPDPKTPPAGPESRAHSQLQRLMGFRASVDEDQILQDMGKMKNKVFQLARQYSQRIKNNRPMVWSRNRDAANQHGVKSTTTAHEERMQRKRGKPSLRLSLNTCEQAVIHEVQSPEPGKPPSSGCSSQSTVTAPHSPHSPQSPQSETFHWPDVQELRSKYAATPSSKLSRSHTVPNGMPARPTDGCNNGSLKCSSCLDLHQGPPDCPASQGPAGEAQTQPQLHPLLCRWSSLDHMLGSLQILPETAGTCDDGAPRAADQSSGKSSESNLVKSLREKFQSLSTSS